jgi:hypothetical protein
LAKEMRRGRRREEEKGRKDIFFGKTNFLAK